MDIKVNLPPQPAKLKFNDLCIGDTFFLADDKDDPLLRIVNTAGDSNAVFLDSGTLVRVPGEVSVTRPRAVRVEIDY